MDTEQIAKAANLLRQATNVVVVTGAGIGRPSGIPDFRSEDGLWSQDDPMEAASMRTFTTRPERFYKWLHPLMDLMLAATPNPAHLALAELERLGLVKGIITQNIDGLHQRAGSQVVYEVHGNILTATCLQTKECVTVDDWFINEIRSGKVPSDAQGNPYKPDIVLFGEMLPEDIISAAQEALSSCDVVLVVGTSLEVHPAGGLPLVAMQFGARALIINLAPTYLDDYASVVVREDVAVALPAIVEAYKAHS